MDRVDLKEYLNIVVNMEKNIYLQNRLIFQMQNRIKQLGQIHFYQEPAIPIKKSSQWFPGVFISGIFLFIGFLIFQWGIELWSWITEKSALALLYAPIVLIFGVCVMLEGIICAIFILVDYLKNINSYQKAKNIYNAAYAEYERNIRIDKERVCKELLEKNILFSELELLQNQNANSKQNLEKIYSKDIIFPKYRNLTMVCSLYEYICSGRCSTLEGHEGAYNILEMEIRLNHIIIQLDRAIARLDSIQHNQYILYSALQETNQQANQILESTNRIINNVQKFQRLSEELNIGIGSIEKNSALSAFQTQCIQKELQYMNRIDYL